MAAEVILRVKVDKSQYKAFKEEVKKGLDAGGTNKVKDSLKETGEAAQNAKTKIQSLGEMLTKKIAWYSISMAISSVTVAFKEALQEIKAVDTQLTNVAKVSGKSMEDLQNLAEKAYSTASKYGVEASKYMEAVYEYTKAGFQENADVMAELSTKAMLVGDTTAAVADKFLIAANAAWKYGKNVDELSLLVDKADYINNNYATTFDKIADGFPRVASVASMAGMTAEETMAALGTITATTQETASRAGTALRALILNILKDTTTEVEDGVTTTQEEIDSLRKVLEIYASDVVKAADATGSLINPMEAIAALSKAYREGALTERELYQIEQALGGKLRTNQLDALLKNFEETYTSMMDGMANAYGTADKEIETMLGSWEAKTNILKNTWTEFVSKGLSSQMFKDAIDQVTTLLNRFGGLNEVLPIAIGFMTSLFAPAIVGNIEAMGAKLKNLGAGFRVLNEETGKIETNWSAIGTAVSIGIMAITTAYTLYENHVRKIRQDSENATREAIESAEASRAKFDNLLSLYTTYKNAEKGTSEYTKAVESLTSALGLESTAIKDVEGNIDSLLDTELQKAISESDIAASKARANILTVIETLDGANGNLVLAAGRRWDVGTDERTGLATSIAVSDEERLRRTIQQYKMYASELKSLEAAYRTSSYDDLVKEWRNGAIDAGTKIWAQKYQETMSEEDMRKRINKLNSYLQETSFVKTYLDQENALKEYKNAYYKMLHGDGSVEALIKAEENLATTQEETEKSAEELAAQQQKVADAFKEVVGQASDATEALDKYKNALEGDTTESNAEALVEGAKKAFEAINKGLKDSREVTAFADLWFSKEQIHDLKERGISLADALISDPKFNRIFISGTDEEGNTVFRDAIDASKELAEILKEFDTDNNMMLTGKTLDEVWGRLYETSEGTKIIVEDWENLANYFGLSTDSLKILLDMYGLLIPGLEASAEDMLAFADAAGAVHETAQGIKQIDLAGVIEAAFNQGATQDEVEALVANLREMHENGDIELLVDCQQVNAATEDTKDLLDLLDLTDLRHVVYIDDSAIDIATWKAENLANKLGTLDQKASTFANADRMYASGTDSATGGMALVNEEGAELIAANGIAWVAGGGRPSIAPIPKGAKIWTARETKAILNNANLAPLFGGIHAFADGTSVPSEIANVPKTTLWESANLFAQDYEDDELKGLQGMVSLRKAELELLKERGGSIEEQNEKQKEIQSAIVDVVRKLQNIGGKQEDINQLAAEWYSIQSAIEESTDTQSEEQQKEKEALEKETSLRKSELTLLEAKGASIKRQTAKQREIQESLMAQVKYLKSIGGDQEEINKLLAEYYNIDKQITEEEKKQEEQKKQKAEEKKQKAEEKKQRQKEREEKLYDLLQAAIQKRMENINKKRDEELQKIDEKKKKLQEEHDIQKENQELQEKQLAVEKAREELANAKKQRTVRIFNSATGQWEWTYNASTVNSARENLKNAKDSLSEYKKEQAYQKRIDSLEAEQQEINDKYDAKIAKWQAVLDTMEEPVRSINSVLKSIEKHATEDMLPAIEKMNEALKNIGDGYVISPEIQKKMMGIGVGQTPGTYRNLGGVPINVSGTPYGVGTQYNGDTYTFGNITLSEQQAKTTTVYQLTQMAGGLRSYAYGT